MPIRFQANKKKAISNFTAATNFVAAFFLLFVSRLATNVAGVAKIREFANRSGQDFRHLPREALNSGGPSYIMIRRMKNEPDPKLLFVVCDTEVHVP